MQASFKNIFLLSKYNYGSCYFCLKYCQIKQEHIVEDKDELDLVDLSESGQNDDNILTLPADIKFIEKYIDSGATALCPHCCIDSVIPGFVSQKKLKELNEVWFGGHI